MRTMQAEHLFYIDTRWTIGTVKPRAASFY